MRQAWSDAEYLEFQRYFRTSIMLTTLWKRIQAINSSRSYESMTREVRRWRKKGFEKNSEIAMRRLKVGYLDIEATNLQASFGHMLSWYIKRQGKNEYDFAVITKKEIDDHDFDKRLTAELLDAFGNYDVLYTHYGADRRFDLPFIRTRAIIHGMGNRLPKQGEKFIMDTWPIARNKLRLHNNRLETIAISLGIRGVKKTPLDPLLWTKARIGDPDSLEYVALHNKRDVQLLERVHRKLEPIERPIYRSM